MTSEKADYRKMNSLLNQMEVEMTEGGLLIFLGLILLLVVIVAVIAVVASVAGASAAIVDEEDSEE